jgi:hypothetical protein
LKLIIIPGWSKPATVSAASQARPALSNNRVAHLGRNPFAAGTDLRQVSITATA